MTAWLIFAILLVGFPVLGWVLTCIQDYIDRRWPR